MDDFLLSKEYSDILNRLARLEANADASAGSFDDIKNSVRDIATKLDTVISSFNNRFSNMEKDEGAREAKSSAVEKSLTEIRTELKEMHKEITDTQIEPLKKGNGRWDSLITGIVSAVVAGLVAFIFVKLGLK